MAGDPSMRAASGHPAEADLVVAAQAGDARALEELVAANLPLVYAMVGRALGALADVDDVVQETMLCVLRDLRALRSPDSFRPWLVAIAMRQVSTYLRRRHVDERATGLDEVADAEAADTEGFVLLRLELSGQRRQIVRASRWLEPDDRALLSLWWLETAGWLTRTELAAAQGLGTAHAGVRVQRMRIQLDLSRSVVAALEAKPRCAQLTAALPGWDGTPSPLWRKRVARHIRSCPVCLCAADGLIPPERLLTAAYGPGSAPAMPRKPAPPAPPAPAAPPPGRAVTRAGRADHRPAWPAPWHTAIVRIGHMTNDVVERAG